MAASRRPSTPGRQGKDRSRPAGPRSRTSVGAPSSAPGTHDEQPRPLWSRLTTRAVVMLLVVAALVTTLAFPLREFVQQRGQIAALEARKAQLEADVASLKEQGERWQDPAYVTAQARARLHYVYPGETGYVVLSPSDIATAREPEVRVESEPVPAWYETFWSSVQAADHEK